MKSISLMNVRKSLGEIIDEVFYKSETFILERSGKPIAKLTPIDNSMENNTDRLALKALKALNGLNPGTERGQNPEEWLAAERGSWD